MKSLRVLTLVLGALTLAQGAKASQYPASYYNQTVRTLSQGPVLFAHVGSGILSQDLVGYRWSGFLAHGRPAQLDAVFVAQCRSHDGASIVRTVTVVLGLEWNGRGYLSAPFSAESLFSGNCEGDRVLKVAFSDRMGRWDSLGGANYDVSPNLIWNASTAIPTGAGEYFISPASYAVIVQSL
jgi:hypothetical protein